MIIIATVYLLQCTCYSVDYLYLLSWRAHKYNPFADSEDELSGEASAQTCLTLRDEASVFALEQPSRALGVSLHVRALERSQNRYTCTERGSVLIQKDPLLIITTTPVVCTCVLYTQIYIGLQSVTILVEAIFHFCDSSFTRH